MIGCCCCRRRPADVPERLFDDRWSDTIMTKPMDADPLTWPADETVPMIDVDRNDARNRILSTIDRILPPLMIIVCSYAADVAYLRRRWIDRLSEFRFSTPNIVGQLQFSTLSPKRTAVFESTDRRYRIVYYLDRPHTVRLRSMVRHFLKTVGRHANSRTQAFLVDESAGIEAALMAAEERLVLYAAGPPYDPPMHPNQRRMLDFVR